MLNCLVIGSGISGLSTALALRKAGHAAAVYEAYSGPSDGVGGFLTLAVNGFDALETLGLKDAARRLGFSTPRMSMYLGSTGRHLADFNYGGMLADGTTARTLTRSELYALLRNAAVEISRGGLKASPSTKTALAVTGAGTSVGAVVARVVASLRRAVCCAM